MRVAVPVLFFLATVAGAGPLTKHRAPPDRNKVWTAAGGTKAVRDAVDRALDWLARHQTDEGFWDADRFGDASGNETDGKGGGWHGEPVPCRFDREVTALATLAFLGAGHTHLGHTRHAPTVRKALLYLKADPSGRTTLWEVAYSAQALAEAFDMTGDKSLRAPVERAVGLLTATRHPRAGWRYFAGSRMASGVPTSAAVVSALAAAERAGFKVKNRFKKHVLAWIDGLADRKTGRVKYHVGSEKLGYTPTTTNAASLMLVRAWLAETKSATFAAAAKAVLKRKPKWSIKFKTMKVKGVERRVQIGYLQHYYWWHASDAFSLSGHAGARAWYGALKSALLPKQRKDGWLAGSWDPVGTYGKVGGRVFSTALCALALESPVRYAK